MQVRREGRVCENPPPPDDAMHYSGQGYAITRWTDRAGDSVSPILMDFDGLQASLTV